MNTLSQETLSRCCPVPGLTFHIRESVPSTNTLLREWAEEGAPHGTVLLSASQTAGRGRRDRAFFSPEGTGLYLSVLLRPDLPAAGSLPLTPCAAVSAALAIEELTGENTQIKWVNDVFLHERKVCGILTEGAAEEGRLRYAVVGIGCNACPPEGGFPPEVADIAGAVLPRFEPLARERLTAAVLNEFFALYPGIAAGAHAEEYRRRCMVPGRRVTVLRGGIATPALALEVDGECRLVVRYEDGRTEALSSGEISIRL